MRERTLNLVSFFIEDVLSEVETAVTIAEAEAK